MAQFEVYRHGQGFNPGHYEYVDVSDAQLRKAMPAKIEVVQHKAPHNHHGLEALLVALTVGAFLAIGAGLIAAMPPKMRGWFILLAIGGVVWLVWTHQRDQAQVRADQIQVAQPIPNPTPYHPTDWAPRAELIRLPHHR